MVNYYQLLISDLEKYEKANNTAKTKMLIEMLTNIQWFILRGEYREKKYLDDLISRLAILNLDRECSCVSVELTRCLEHLKCTLYHDEDAQIIPLNLRKTKIREKLDNKIYSLLLLFSDNILLACIDQCLIENKDFREKLIEIYQRIKVAPSLFQKPLVYKTTYLFWKITTVYDKDLNFELRYSYQHSYLDILKEIEENKFNSEEQVFDKGGDRIKEVITFRDKHLVDCTICDYYYATKHYKEDHRSIELLNNLLESFKNSYYNAKNDSKLDVEEKRRWDLTYNFILNNRLSLLLNDIKFDPVYVSYKDLIREIEVIQKETGIYNYYPYLKIVGFISKIAEVEFLKEEPDLNKIVDCMKQFDFFYNQLIKNHTYSLKTHLQVFEKPEEYCFTKKMFESKSIYIASSDIMPISYHKLGTSLREVKEKIKITEHLSHVHKKISEHVAEVKKIRTEVEGNNKNQVQILGIFSALVFVAAGGINIFKEIDNVKTAGLFTILFTYSISIMVLLIWIVFDHSNKSWSWKHSFAFVLMIIATGGVFYLLQSC